MPKQISDPQQPLSRDTSADSSEAAQDSTQDARYSSLLAEASSIARRYLLQIRDRHVGVTPQAIENLSRFNTPLPARGLDPHETLQLLDSIGSPATIASTGGRYFGAVTGGALPVTVAARWISAAWDQNAALFNFSPVGAYLEDLVLRWLFEIFGLPGTCAGALVTGTQMADLTCLAAARSELLRKAGWDVEGQGQFGAPPITVVTSEETHTTMMKAFALMGFGRDRVRLVPTDSQGRMQPSHIPQLLRAAMSKAENNSAANHNLANAPLLICAQVGNVNTGASDPIHQICEMARRENSNSWVHVDGAFGLWAAASPARKYLVDGLSLADSFATDAHKYLNVPYDSGIAIVRHPESLRRAMAISAAYLSNAPSHRDPMIWGPDSSRCARAIEIWAALRTLGREGVAELIERTCAHAATFAKNLRDAGYEILNEVVLNQVLVSFGDDHATNRVVAALQEAGTCWCGGTTWKGRRAMRISVSSWATTAEDVESSTRAMLSIASTEARK